MILRCYNKSSVVTSLKIKNNKTAKEENMKIYLNRKPATINSIILLSKKKEI
jgi:hypothetical protein